MATSPRMSHLAHKLSREGESWQDLVDWNGEIYDTFFHGEANIGSTSNDSAHTEPFASNVAGSVTSEQSFIPSIATPTFEGSFSFDYVNSRPSSFTEGPSSFDHGQFWGSPSYTTSATSPLVAPARSPNHGSFEACETMLSPGYIPSASPLLDTRSWGSSSSYQTAPTSGLFNPHLQGTPHSFSGPDVYASQVLNNIGTWAEPAVGPVAEVQPQEGSNAMPIPIPQVRPQALGNSFPTLSWNHTHHQPTPHVPSSQARAITIPQPHVRSADAQSHHSARINMGGYPLLRRQSHRVSRAPVSTLSVSPEQRRISRTAQLSHSFSNSRRSRNGSVATPSPVRAELGWVAYQPDEQQRLKPSGAEGGHRRHKGRTGPLSAQRRSEAAVMRHVGSCSNCKKRKEKCDPGTPCKSCLEHYGNDLINHPCRDRLVSGLAGLFLNQRHGWHPTVRPISDYSDAYYVDPDSYSIPINFGFGSTLHVPVNIVQFETSATNLVHEHIIYSWPPDASSSESHTHAVLPVTLSPEAANGLEDLLETHLSLLVDQHFRSFPLFTSPLRILSHVYVFARSLSTASPHAHLLRQSLKLLVLVHVGGDITLPDPTTSGSLSALIRATTSLPPNTTPTPCFLRSQFGAVMPRLALRLMREALVSLEQLFLTRSIPDWPVALATFLVLLMAIESIQYHAAKLPYHHAHDAPMVRSQSARERDFAADDDGVRQLLEFYRACFGGCHARLSPEWRGDGALGTGARRGLLKPEERFVESVREAIRGASPEYLEERARAERNEDDMGFFFDRLVARLLVLDLRDADGKAP